MLSRWGLTDGGSHGGRRIGATGRPAPSCGYGGSGRKPRLGGAAIPWSPGTVVRHPPRVLGCAPVRLSVVHPVTAPARRHPARSDLRYQRGPRLRGRGARRADGARVRRPGTAAPAAQVLDRLPHQRRHPLRALLRLRAVLAVRDPPTDGGDRLQRPARRGLSPRRGAGLLSPPPDRARHPRRVPPARTPAQALDRATRRVRRRLDRGRRPCLGDRHRSTARRPGRPRQPELLAPRHDDRGRGAPAHDDPAVGRARLARTVGLVGPARAQLHRHRPVGVRHRAVHRPSGEGTDPVLRRTGVVRRRGVPCRPGGRRPDPAGRLPAQEPARGDDDRQRLGRSRRGGLLRVPQRRRLRHDRDPVLLPPVVALLPGRPVQGPRGGPRPLRRRVRQLVETAARPAPPAVRRRGEPGVLRRRDRFQR